MVFDIILKKNPELEISSEPVVLEQDDPVISCRNCLETVSRPEFTMEINHAFAHTFANPNGNVFEIGCFSRADGCVNASATSEEFTWFKGYVWAVGICRACHTQLGWIFLPVRTGEMGKFYGLILDELIFP